MTPIKKIPHKSIISLILALKIILLHTFWLRQELNKYQSSFVSSFSSSLYQADNCQARVQSPKVKTKRTWADTKITKLIIVEYVGLPHVLDLAVHLVNFFDVILVSAQVLSVLTLGLWTRA